MESHTHLPNELLQVGEPMPSSSHLANHKLWQLVEELHQEITQSEMNAPLSSLPPSKWACPSGSREPEEDDQEVTFPGGEGRVH